MVRKLSFDIGARETLAIVGESGSGKSVASLSLMRLLPSRASRVEGSVRLEGQELLTLDAEAMRRVRGAGIAMIFQEPMTSLNPVFPIGDQIAEAISCHQPVGDGLRRARKLCGSSTGSGCRTRGGASATIRTSSRAACGSA